jgi:hypothetical protein
VASGKYRGGGVAFDQLQLGAFMVFGLSLSTFTIIHTVIALIGIATGLVVFVRWMLGHGLDVWNTIFLVSTLLTSVTGFMFPYAQWLPSHAFGVMSLIALAAALAALYHFHLTGVWRKVYVGTTLFALYLNCFVTIVQAFLKIPSMKALAPTQSEGPFLTAQFILLVLFIAGGTFAAIRFRPQPAAA